jgi:hypothetical protein
MPFTKRASQFTIVSLLTTVLTATFLFMAPLGARYMHAHFGRWPYWVFSIFSTAALLSILPQWALAQGAVLLLIGLYTELEQQKFSRFYAALASVSISLVAIFFSVAVWAQNHKTGLIPFLKKQVSDTILLSPQLKSLPVQVDAMQIVSVLPAFVAFLLMILIFFAVLFIRPEGKKDKMTTFKIPEATIWVFTVALAGSFLIDPLKAFVLQKVSYNILFICSSLYYFQGLAVLGYMMDRLRLNYFLKVAFFFIMAFHLFALVVALGLSDVWFGYRSKVFKNLIKNNPYAGD